MFILSQIHLSLSLSPCFSPSLFPPAEGPTAWMRCWVHGNWVSIDWTAAWPMGARGWEQQHRLRLSSPILQKNIHAAQLKVQGKKQNIMGFFWGGNASTSQHIVFSAVCWDGRPFFSIGCIIWVTGCITWAGLTVIFYCDVATEDGAAMSVCLVSEALMWKYLLRLLPCQHVVTVHTLSSLIPLYLTYRKVFKIKEVGG